MKGIDLEFNRKFWDILGRMGRGTAARYQDRCEKDVFVSRVSRILFSPDRPMKVLFSKESAFEFLMPLPERNITTSGKDRKYKQYAMSFAYGYSDEVFFEFLNFKGEMSKRDLKHNDCLFIMYEEIEPKTYNGMLKHFLAETSIKFEREYRLIKDGLKEGEISQFVDGVKVKNRKGMISIKEFLDSKYPFRKAEKTGFNWGSREIDVYFIDIDKMDEKELIAFRDSEAGRMTSISQLYNLANKFI